VTFDKSILSVNHAIYLKIKEKKLKEVFSARDVSGLRKLSI